MYAFRRKYNPDKELENLNGKVALVTGGSNGLGYWTVRWLVRRGAKVYMGARSQAKADEAIKLLKEEGWGNLGGTIIWHELDLSHPRLAKESGEKFLQRETRLDILVNNAAKAMCAYKLTDDGIQDVVVVNHLSPAALTQAVLPLLEATAKLPGGDVRIVNVGSEAHRRTGPIESFIGKEAFNKRYTDGMGGEITRYGYSKLAHLLYTRELQRRVVSENIVAMVADPGGAVTGGVIAYFSKKPLGWLLIAILKFIGMTKPQAAMTSAYASASKTIAASKDKYKGQMLAPYGILEEPSTVAQDPRLAKELWETTQEVLGELNALSAK